MRNKLLLLSFLAMITAILAFSVINMPEAKKDSFDFNEMKSRSVIRCSPDWENLKDWLDEAEIPPIPGSGSHSWKISTTHDSAQFYFNQGINMYYSFHLIEAMASFKKAGKFDPDCAMIHWAQALTYGPNINDYGYAASPEALEALQKSQEQRDKASELEKALIDAMSVRYTTDSADINRAILNKEYTGKMKSVYEKFPSHPDVQALYADAMMLDHPWDLWTISGKPKPWTPLIQQVLENLLEKAPDHPGANHYYIHVMEPSPYFSKALPSADRLGKITPALSHTVHMPSHIYLRSGAYDKGVSVNENAVNSYNKVVSLFPPASGNEFIYVMHNLHMQTNNAMLQGRAAYSKQSGEATMKSVPEDYLKLEAPLGNYMQYLYMTPIFVHVRFGHWDELISDKAPGEAYPYANVLYHFGKGMAYAKKGKLKEAVNELEQLIKWSKDSALLIPMSPFSPVIEGAKVAKSLLKGTIAMAEKKYDEAILAFKAAVETEENMVYTEPRDWMLNPKHYLGHAYLEKGDGLNAEKVFLNDLKNNNENGWALMGLYKSLILRNKSAEAEKIKSRYNKAFEKADIRITSSVQ